ncbi:hypothetical protein [Armatimonas sp.]|uniref:hypothetical protein n=1 Tax=Armatimonas sp. TaxID=1872638 RepID=UPI0037500B2D
MQQQFQQPEEKRYDAKKLQQVVELATRLQHQHYETLTAAQVEQMGEDLGLSPEFIRKALVLVEEEETQQYLAPTSHVEPLARVQTEASPKRLSRKTIRKVLLPALAITPLVWVVGPILAVAMQSDFKPGLELIIMGIMVAVPAVAALVSGASSRSRRAGLLGGAAVGLISWVGFLLTVVPSGNYLSSMLIGLMFYLGGASALASLAVALRRWWKDRPASEDEGPRRVQ